MVTAIPEANKACQGVSNDYEYNIKYLKFSSCPLPHRPQAAIQYSPRSCTSTNFPALGHHQVMISVYRMNFFKTLPAKLCRPGVTASNNLSADPCLKRLRLDGITLPEKSLKNSFYRNLHSPGGTLTLNQVMITGADPRGCTGFTCTPPPPRTNFLVHVCMYHPVGPVGQRDPVL